jgi:amino acid adenylation domain-containing protein
VWELEGALNIPALNQALRLLMERHEILRTTFHNVMGEMKQRVETTNTWPAFITLIDLSTVAEKEVQVEKIVHQSLNTAFELHKGPLLRVILLKLEEEKHVFALVIHHIISDGWSMHIMFQEILEEYKNGVLHTGKQLPIPRLQYKDYCGWLNGQFSAEKLSAHRQYWLQQLSGELPVLDLPADYPRPSRKSFRGGSCVVNLNGQLTHALRELGEKEEVSLFMILMAAVNTLLYRYTGQQDIIIGTVVAGRDHADLENQLGFYVNTLALRTNIGDNETSTSLLQQVKQNVLNAFNHQLYPFDLLLEDLQLNRDLSRSPLFEIMLVLQNVQLAGNQHSEMEGIAIKPYPVKSEHTKFDLVFNCTEVNDELLIQLNYNSDLFSGRKMERMLDHLQRLLLAFSNGGAGLLDSIALLSDEDTQLIWEQFNNTGSIYPAEKTITALFEEQVHKTPDHPAIVDGSSTLTYDQLNRQANRLAHHLQAVHGVTRADIVGVLMERSDLLVISILAILKCGAAYLPIDPAYPAGRIHQILDNSQVKMILTSGSQEPVPAPADVMLLNINTLHLPDQYPEDNLLLTATTQDPAYVIYTSGSSGQPKGVMVGHQSLINLCCWHIRSFNLNETSKATLYAGVGFDAAVWETWPYLLSGGCLYPVNPEIRLDKPQLVTFLKTQEITHTFLPTIICEQLTADDCIALPEGLFIFTGGDRLRKYPRSQRVQVINNYGPTEATVVTTSIALDPHTAYTNIPIGKPISNTVVLILDPQRNLLSPGIPGEIFIGGDQLSMGYLNEPALTREKFIPYPNGPAGNMTLYATGDKGRWLEDGNIEFLGREDQQVKIRGYRIELKEIEYALLKQEAISNAVVLLRGKEEPLLAAWYISNEELPPASLKRLLAEQLPFYMVPSFLIRIAAFPMTANGKINYEALAEMELDTVVKRSADADVVEAKLIDMWKEVLNRKDIGIDTNFFEAGGHSLKATQIIARINKELGVSIDLAAFFLYQTPEELALFVKSMPGVSFIDIEPVEAQDHYGLSFSQKRLWIVNAVSENSVAYNIPAAYTFTGQLNKPAFKKAFDILVEQYEILRTAFRVIAGEPRQVVYPYEAGNNKLEYLEYRKISGKDDHPEEGMREIISTKFDLEKGPLIKAMVMERSDNDFIFVLTVHHMILDGWSLGIMFGRLVSLYNACCREEAVFSAAPGIQYKDYAGWQAKMPGQQQEQARQYWLDQFREPTIALKLEQDFKRPAEKTFGGSNIIFEIPAAETAELHTLKKEHGVTLFMMLMASVNVFLYKLSGSTDITIGIPTAGRTHKSLEDQLGFFINTLALRTKFSGEDSFLELLNKTRTQTLNGFRYDFYPFEQLTDELKIKHDKGRNPLFDVFITLQNAVKEIKEELLGISVEYLPLESTGSQFDLSFDFWEAEDKILVKLNYSTDLFTEHTAKGFITTYLELFRRIIRSPAAEIGQLLRFDPLEASLIEGRSPGQSRQPLTLNKINRASKQINYE